MPDDVSSEFIYTNAEDRLAGAGRENASNWINVPDRVPG